MNDKPTPQIKAEARRVLAAAKLRLKYDRDAHALIWLHDGRGPSERAGTTVRGETLTVAGVSVSSERVKWMLANETPLYKTEVLVDDGYPIHARRAVTRKALALALKDRRAAAEARGVSPGDLPLQFTSWRNPDGSTGRFDNTHTTRN